MSNAAQRVKTLSDFVKHYLEIDKMYRDNDEKLVARFWFDQASRLGYNPKTTTFQNGLKLLAEGKLSSADDITRARRKVQEQHPELYGDKRPIRVKKEREVRKEINDTENPTTVNEN
jgi:hypothetical protein